TLVVARGATVEEALAQNDRAAAVLAGQPGVAAVYSLASVCSSLATQEANLRRWGSFWTPHRRTTLQRTLALTRVGLGLAPDALGPFWKTLAARPAMLTLDTFRGTPLAEALNERVALATGDAAVSTLLKLEDRSQAAHLREALPGMIVLDHQDFAAHVAM